MPLNLMRRVRMLMGAQDTRNTMESSASRMLVRSLRRELGRRAAACTWARLWLRRMLEVDSRNLT